MIGGDLVGRAFLWLFFGVSRLWGALAALLATVYT
jgi:hypothetical protein